MTTPGDESRTELAWREIVEHYGERAVLPDEPASADPDAGPADAARTSYDDLPAGSSGARPSPADTPDDPDDTDLVERDEVPAAERFQPPAAPPFPRPRTWQRGLAWAGLFVAPVLALVVGLFSLGLPSLVGWALVAWFVGGFLYLVREMPRAPRDPWDDGSRI